VTSEDKNEDSISKPYVIERHPYSIVIICGLILLVLVPGDTALGIALNGDLSRGTFVWVSATAIISSVILLLILIKATKVRRARRK